MGRGATARGLILAAGLAASLVAPAQAATRKLYSYDAASPAARALTGVGLTFQFRPKLLGAVRIERFMLTGRSGSAGVRPASEGALQTKGGLDALLGESPRGRALYEIRPDKDGQSLIRVACPGSARGWMAVGPIRYGEDLTLHILGDDPLKGGARLCGTYQYRFKGEWKLPETAVDVPENDGPVPAL